MVMIVLSRDLCRVRLSSHCENRSASKIDDKRSFLGEVFVKMTSLQSTGRIFIMKEKKSAILICAKRGNKEANEAAHQVIQWIKGQKLEVLDVTETDGKISPSKVKNVKLGVVIGGDGTFLTLVRRLEQKDAFPIMGINLGTLGFITDIGREEMLTALRAVLANEFPEETRSLLDVELWRGKKLHESGSVFNDVVLTKDAKTTMVKFDVHVDKGFLSYLRADGYIVATPTGSTGYSLSAGGPLIHPAVASMILTPICSHSLSARSIVLPPKTELELHLREFRGSAYLVFDGQINFLLKQADRIRVTLSKSQLRLIRSPQQKWLETLRSKLNMT